MKLNNTITNDDTRDIAIRCVDSLEAHSLIKSSDGFEIQDIIHDEINKTLKKGVENE